MNASAVYERRRRRYRPKPVKVLFVPEAPAGDPRRFFYFERVSDHDWLLRALMQWLYDDVRAYELRVRELPLPFQVDGY